jgi:S-adenosylmethionine:tRNA ribosyltransferase-isomerase
MDRRDFNYELPAELIAQEPLPKRTASRLLVLDPNSGTCQDESFTALVEQLRPGDLLVLNDTRVIPARIHGHKSSGGRIEILIERVTGQMSATVQIRASKSPKAGSLLHLADGATARVDGREDAFFRLTFDREIEPYLKLHGDIPLPPYIERAPTREDDSRYQTVFAREPGAVAAPTAGLHFDDALLVTLGQRGIEHAFLTLHVGAGTFSPVRTDRIEEHRLHHERACVSQALCDRIRQTKAVGGRVVAVGTTAVRALESSALNGEVAPFNAETDLFIYPGFRFQVVDAIVTNFHLPESSLLMLVSAFAGREQVLAAYEHAITKGYRFFSYGDAMFTVRLAAGAST